MQMAPGLPHWGESLVQAKSTSMNLHPSGKYYSLDAWRGLAALAVVCFHSGEILSAETLAAGGLVAAVFKFGYLGVFIFFPLSGYCILNALSSGQRHGPAEYFRRRLWRIYPAYWGSLLFIYLSILAALPFNRGSLADLGRPWWEWLGLLTLTQGFFNPGLVNAVYWTLCLEVQFYVVAGLVLFLRPVHGKWFLLASAVTGCLYRMPDWPWTMPGLFLERWLEFLVGAAVVGWRVAWLGRMWSITIWSLAGITTLATSSLELGVSLVVALIILVLQPWDAVLSHCRVVKILSFFGAFSYSLYLIHYPFMRQAHSLFARVYHGSPVATYWLSVLTMAGIGITAGLMLYYLIERPCLRARRQKPPVAAPR